MNSNTSSYTSIAKLLHWLMGSIWIAVWIVGILAVYFRDSLNPNHGLTYWHKAFASALLFLLVLRVVWRATHTPPAMPAQMTRKMKQAAQLGHLALYTLALAALPISGWIWSSIADKPIMVLGLFQLPPLMPANPDAYEIAKWAHVACAWTSVALVAGHIAMAIKHHWVDRDHVLLSMAPRFKSKR